MRFVKIAAASAVISLLGMIPPLGSRSAEAANWYYVFCASNAGKWDWLHTEHVTNEMYAHGANVYRDTAYYYGHWESNQWWPDSWGHNDIGTRCSEVEVACKAQMGADVARAQIAGGDHNQTWRQLASCEYWKVSD